MLSVLLCQQGWLLSHVYQDLPVLTFTCWSEARKYYSSSILGICTNKTLHVVQYGWRSSLWFNRHQRRLLWEIHSYKLESFGPPPSLGWKCDLPTGLQTSVGSWTWQWCLSGLACKLIALLWWWLQYRMHRKLHFFWGCLRFRGCNLIPWPKKPMLSMGILRNLQV